HPEVQATAIRRDLVITPGIVRIPRLGTAVVQRRGLADAVHCPVRIGVGNDQRAIALAGVDVQREGVAAAEDVFLADTGRQNDLVGGAVADTKVDQARWLFLDVYVDIDLVGAARNRSEE